MSSGVRLSFDTNRVKKRILTRMSRVQAALDTQVLKDSNFYIPKDTGNLESSGVRGTIPGSGKVIWDSKYARKLYYNPQYNFSKDSNPNAAGKWFERAKARRKKQWRKIAQHEFNV